MAGQRTLPGLGLSAFWTPGSNNWETQHDPDTRKLSVLAQASVLSKVTSLPGSPIDGDIYIVPTADANGDSIAARDNGAWVYYVPQEGWLAYVKDEDAYTSWDGTAWVAFSGGGAPGAPGADGADGVGVPAGGTAGQHLAKIDGTDYNTEWVDPPSGSATEIAINSQAASYSLVLTDANKYVRVSNASANNLTVPANATVAFPVGTTIQLRQAGAGQMTVVAAGGVTINSTETLKLRQQHSSASLIKVATDEWDLTGDLELAP